MNKRIENVTKGYKNGFLTIAEVECVYRDEIYETMMREHLGLDQEEELYKVMFKDLLKLMEECPNNWKTHEEVMA